MVDEGSEQRTGIRYQPDENPPAMLALGLGLQLAVLCVGGIVLTPAIVVRAAGGSEAFLSWAVFAAVVVSGLSTALQAIRVGRVGSGYVLAMGTSGAFIAVCVTAVADGGPAMLATLVVVSSLFQFALSARLSLFRRILTPVVSGTVIMLIPVTVMPIIFGLLDDVPDGSPAAAAPLSAVATVLAIVAVALKATGVLRLWALVIGVLAGSAVAGYFGLYDVGRVAEAPWLGIPKGEWPGLDLGFGPVFWKLLPAFAFVTLVGAIETIGDSVAIQRVSWRWPRAVDFRSVQGAVAADGVGNLLSGLAGTVPNTTYSTSISVTELTGVGGRGVGVALGAIFVLAAFSPKLLSVILAIPGPVVAAYVTVLLEMLFVVGMRIVVQDGIDYRKGLIAGVAFWMGVGFQNDLIYPQYVAEFAALSGWDKAMANRLDAAAEETLLTLLQQNEADRGHPRRRLLLIAHKEGGVAVLEFIAAPGEENLQDRIALLGEQAGEAPVEREVSLRLLRHIASSVRHQQYHDADIVTVRVEAPA